MKNITDVDFGPLSKLIGKWQGKRGVDVSPEPDGIENNSFYETIEFSAVGEVSNAEEQYLAAVHYHQRVYRNTNDKPLHDQTGYWLWDASQKTLIHSFTVPRGICVLAGGRYDLAQAQENHPTVLQVTSSIDHAEWPIIQTMFMSEKAKTLAFDQSLSVGDEHLSYQQKTLLDIYGKTFTHTDESELQRVQ